MSISRNIAFRPEIGNFGLCDFFLPDRASVPDIAVLTIHGGGWGAMSKESFEGIALWLCNELGLPVCNINYRLTGTAPWPACGDDCLAAADFLLKSSLIPGCPEKRRIFVLGGSAGGHLALMTGLRLPPEKVVGIVSISGIGDLNEDRALDPARYRGLFGHEPSEAEIRNASPASYLTPDSPPIFCTHEFGDIVVPIASAKSFLEAVRKNGTDSETFFYSKPEETGYSHRIWIPGSAPHKLYPEIEAAIASFIKRQTNPHRS